MNIFPNKLHQPHRVQLRASIIFAHLQPGQAQILSGQRWVWGRSVYVAALRLDDGELLIVITPDSPTTAISDYGKRYQPIKVKKHGRKAKSLFRYGLDYLRSIFTDLDLKQSEFLDSLKLLSCT